MDYKTHIMRVIDYIESNLKNEIKLSDCARVSGYSEYHFIRVFKEAVGLTPADYIRKRRLTEIVKNMRQGVPISDIAFEYGFNLTVIAYKSDEACPPNFWNKYNSRKWSKKLSGGKVCEDYGISAWNKEEN